MIVCEHCNKDGIDTREAHSMLIVLQKVSPEGYSFYQCDQGLNTVNGCTKQHWYCSREDMKLNLQCCINDHCTEEKLQRIPVEQVQLHKVVLVAGLPCKICNAPISAEGYRFSLTHATPKRSFPDNSYHTLGEWCCSLEHARQNVLTTLSNQ